MTTSPYGGRASPAFSIGRPRTVRSSAAASSGRTWVADAVTGNSILPSTTVPSPISTLVEPGTSSRPSATEAWRRCSPMASAGEASAARTVPSADSPSVNESTSWPTSVCRIDRRRRLAKHGGGRERRGALGDVARMLDLGRELGLEVRVQLGQRGVDVLLRDPGELLARAAGGRGGVVHSQDVAVVRRDDPDRARSTFPSGPGTTAVTATSLTGSRGWARRRHPTGSRPAGTPPRRS